MLSGGSGHLFAVGKVAESVGWPAGSPFQREGRMWDATTGIAALLCLKCKDEYRTAILIGGGLYSLAAGPGHVRTLQVHGDTPAGTAGVVMYMASSTRFSLPHGSYGSGKDLPDP
jgi:hypothetical protein